MRRRAWAVVAACVLAGGTGIAGDIAGHRALGDVIETTDGHKYTGTMQRVGAQMVIKTSDGKTVSVSPSAIAKVTLTDSLTPAEAAASEWKRVQALAAKAPSLEGVVKLEQDFLAKYPDAPASAEAKASLDAHQKLVGKGAVKFRGEWMTPDMMQEKQQGWEKEAEPALTAYKAGRLDDARKAAASILEAHAENPVALAVSGLASYRLNDLAKARAALTKLASVDPSNVIALNDLGVISSDQHNVAEAMNFYARAIEAKPGNRQVLDNAVAAMGAYTGSKENDVYKNLARVYGAAEADMETEMAKRGLYRFGSTWVPTEVKSKVGNDRQQIQTKMAQLDAQFAVAKQSLDHLDQQLASVQQQYDQTVTNLQSLNMTNVGTTRGNFQGTDFEAQRGLYASQLQTLAGQKATLQAQRDQAAQSLQPFYAEAAKLKAELAALPEVPYGPQRILDLGQDDDPPAPTGAASLMPSAASAPAP
ncbi:MAG TPA: tetratricopeptide repeat protein [Phycisphaerae bacterium]|nr:tetratricopeptide repeat protein [Phycisphaerae bacterium]